MTQMNEQEADIKSVNDPAPPHSLPSYSECQLRVLNSNSISKRIAEGGFGNEYGVPVANDLHRFIYEYDDADPYRSAWFLHRLELALKAYTALQSPTGMALVPLNPTRAMQDAWDRAPSNEDTDVEWRGAYAAMLAATPQSLSQDRSIITHVETSVYGGKSSEPVSQAGDESALVGYCLTTDGEVVPCPDSLAEYYKAEDVRHILESQHPSAPVGEVVASQYRRVNPETGVTEPWKIFDRSYSVEDLRRIYEKDGFVIEVRELGVIGSQPSPTDGELDKLQCELEAISGMASMLNDGEFAEQPLAGMNVANEIQEAITTLLDDTREPIEALQQIAAYPMTKDQELSAESMRELARQALASREGK